MDKEVQEGILRALTQANIVSAQQVQEVQQELEKGGSLREFLVDRKRINDEVYAKAFATALHMPYVDVREGTIHKNVVDIVPESTAREHLIIAYDETEDLVKVAMADPSDRQIVEFIHKKVDRPVEVAVASATSIRETIEKYRASLDVELKGLIQQAQGAARAGDDLLKVSEDLPIVNVTDSILRHAILQGASDIHIEPTEQSVIVRYRIDGILRSMLELPKEVLAALVARIKVLSNLKIDEHRLPQDGRFKVQTDEYKVSFRVSTLPVFDGEKVVMRLLDESGQGLMLDHIGMRERELKIFRRNVAKPHGLVLVTGPTGSGKTTTLYAAMREINTPEVNISTIEDPIEYRMEGINQTQVRPKIGLSFSTGLRSLVRQDPDIIMVGEIRDEETASLAINAALTGHLVLSTLHTNSAVGAIPRLVDMKVEPFLIASTANLMLAQRLVRQLCEYCRKQVPIDEQVLESIRVMADPDVLLAAMKKDGVVKENATWGDLTMYVPAGCHKCHEGYKKRIGIYEVFEITPEVQTLITSNVTSNKLEEAARAQGMVTMVEDGFIKVIEGKTSVEEVLRVAKE